MRKRSIFVLLFGAFAVLFLAKKTVFKGRVILKQTIAAPKKSRGKKHIILPIIFCILLIFFISGTAYFWQRMAAENRSAEGEYAEGQAKLTVLEEELNARLARKEGLLDSYGQLVRIIAESRNKIFELENISGEKKQTAANLEQQLGTLKAQVASLNFALGELESQLSATESDILQLQQIIEGIEQEIARLKKELG